MIPFNHIAPVIVLPEGSKSNHWHLGGTGFCFRAPEFILTAAHCIGDAVIGQIGILNFSDRKIIRAIDILKHNKADIVIMRLSSNESRLIPFWNFVSNYSLGEQFYTYGFPYEDQSTGERMITPRLFTGIFQRFFDYSHGPWNYLATELNIPAPMGLSGGPLFRPGAPQMLTGMVTANFESQAIVDYYEEQITEKEKHIYKTSKVVTYGVALLLDQLADWLNEHLPQSEPSKYASGWHE
jgi:S1-C subfamily serine protease